MRKELLIFILLVSIFLSGCGKQKEEEKLGSINPEYKVNACGVETITGAINTTIKKEDKIYAAVYAKGMAVSEGRYSVVIYDTTNDILSRIVLQGKEEMVLLELTILENGNYKALMVVWDADKSSCTTLLLQTFDPQGNLVEEQDVTKLVNDAVDDTILLDGYLLDGKGDLYFYTTNYTEDSMKSKIYTLNLNGEVTLRKEVEGSVLAFDNVSSQVWLAIGDYSDKVQLFNMSTSDLSGEKLDIVWELPGQSFYLSDGLTDNQKFVVQQNKVYEYDLTTGKAKLLFAYEDLGLQAGLINTGKLTAIEQDVFYVPRKVDETEDGKRIYDWVKIIKSDETIQKEILTIAVAEENSLLKEAVVAFNKASDTYKAVIKVYEKDGVNNQSIQLQGDIAAGRIPDMISTELMELDLLINKGMAWDLTSVLEGDTELSKDDFVGRSLEIYQRGDKLYAIPCNIGVLALTGKQKLLNERIGWTLQEFEEYANSLQNPQAVTDGISRDDMLQAVLEMYLYQFVDWEKKVCSFENTEFIELLQFVKKYPSQSLDFETDMGKLIEAMQEDDIILYPGAITSIDNYQMMNAVWGEEVQWVGYPTEKGNGIQLLDMDVPLVITENSAHKEEMWQILKYMITNPKLVESGIPAYEPLFEKACSQAMDKNMSEVEAGYSKELPKAEIMIDGLRIEIYAVTESEIMELKKLITTAEPVMAASQEIKKIICEEVSVYFNGQKSAEEVSKIIQNRASLYLNES